MKMTQKEAVFSATVNVVGEFEGAYTPTKEQRAQVNNILFQGFRAETIELDRTYNDSELKAYVSGLQSNWLRKDSRLNGGIKYVPKNPGSRAGSGTVGAPRPACIAGRPADRPADRENRPTRRGM